MNFRLQNSCNSCICYVIHYFHAGKSANLTEQERDQLRNYFDDMIATHKTLSLPKVTEALQAEGAPPIDAKSAFEFLKAAVVKDRNR